MGPWSLEKHDEDCRERLCHRIESSWELRDGLTDPPAFCRNAIFPGVYWQGLDGDEEQGAVDGDDGFDDDDDDGGEAYGVDFGDDDGSPEVGALSADDPLVRCGRENSCSCPFPPIFGRHSWS